MGTSRTLRCSVMMSSADSTGRGSSTGVPVVRRAISNSSSKVG
jgi:hypothetical protein